MEKKNHNQKSQIARSKEKQASISQSLEGFEEFVL